MKIGFDNDKYLTMQSAHIRERIRQFGGKLYQGIQDYSLLFLHVPQPL